MDTTLRDGEQTSGVSFTASEKLTLARLLLDELKVDRIEIASARVSEGEFKSVQQIADWAKSVGYLERIPRHVPCRRFFLNWNIRPITASAW